MTDYQYADDAELNVRVLLDDNVGTPLDVEDLEMMALHNPNPEPWPISGDELTIRAHRATYGDRWREEAREAYLQGSTVWGVTEP